MSDDAHIRMCTGLFDSYRVAVKLFMPMDKRDGLRICEKLQSGLEARVTAPNNRDVHAREKGTVAGSTVGNALVLKFLRTRNIKLPAPGARRNEHCFRAKFFARLCRCEKCSFLCLHNRYDTLAHS